MRSLALVVALTAALLGGGSVLASNPALAERPSFVVIQTDDQPLEEFRGAWTDSGGVRRPIMPKTKQLIRDRGIEFRQYLTPYPLCAPSRATLWSGQYADNHGVRGIGGSRGDWPAYRSGPILRENLAVWLQRAGYRTAHFGKFMNHYGGRDRPAERIVPPGWGRWVTDATDRSNRLFYGYRQNRDGAISPPQGNPLYGPSGGRDPLGCPARGLTVCRYHTDSISIRAAREVRGLPRSQPFFVQIDYHTPHLDPRPPEGPEPASRHYDTASRSRLPRSPAFNEQDVSDKPDFIRRGAPALTRRELRDTGTIYRKSIEALRSVDEGVARMITALRATGRLRNTYVIFTSDNGFFLGQHRLSRGKLLPYEPALRVPFVMRGPGIRPGSRSQELVANQDIAPTLLDLAGASASGYTPDGRSMKPFWQQPRRISRRPILLSSSQAEIRGDGTAMEAGEAVREHRAGISVKAPVLDYVGIRLGPYKYVRYRGTTQGELYVLTRDPYELRNRFNRPGYTTIQAYLDNQLNRLEGCHGAGCLNPAPPWPEPPVRKR